MCKTSKTELLTCFSSLPQISPSLRLLMCNSKYIIPLISRLPTVRRLLPLTPAHVQGQPVEPAQSHAVPSCSFGFSHRGLFSVLTTAQCFLPLGLHAVCPPCKPLCPVSYKDIVSKHSELSDFRKAFPGTTATIVAPTVPLIA